MLAAQDKKGQAPTVIDVSGECSYTDFLVIVSAKNERQTTAIAEGVTDALRTEHGVRPLYREGQGGWVLLDYGDVIVHVFQEDTREHYDIDRLWANAPRIPVPAVEAEAVAKKPEPAPTSWARRHARR
ncbi:ribosome silencing factor [Myxococcota bacterium]|nr:ribosome silencing factor [Myxococcota bacterium]